MNKLSIIRFNDDNHAERIWTNGEYIGSLNDIEYVLKNFMNICKEIMTNNNKLEDIESTSIWVCDDFADYEEDDDFIEDIWFWFNEVEKMTEEQMELVKQRKWEELHKII